MILDNINTTAERVSRNAKLVADIKEAISYAKADFKPEHLGKPVKIWLSFYVLDPMTKKRISTWDKRHTPRTRVTPVLNIDPDNYDMAEVLRSIEDRLTREKLSWDTVEIDPYRCFQYYRP